MGDVIIQQLEHECKHLENAIEHLQRSNKELKEAIIDQGDGDREYKTAIEENIVVIAKYKSKVQSLKDEIDQLRSGNRDTTNLAAAITHRSDDNDGMHL